MANQVLSVEIDKKTLDEVKYMLDTVRYGVNDALRIGANKTAETAQSRVVKSLASDLTLTQKKLRADTELVRAYYENLSSKVIVKSKPIPIIDFKTGAQLKSGININSTNNIDTPFFFIIPRMHTFSSCLFHIIILMICKKRNAYKSRSSCF